MSIDRRLRQAEEKTSIKKEEMFFIDWPADYIGGGGVTKSLDQAAVERAEADGYDVTVIKVEYRKEAPPAESIGSIWG